MAGMAGGGRCDPKGHGVFLVAFDPAAAVETIDWQGKAPQINTPENRAAPFAYKAVVEMAGSTETDKVRESPGGTGRLNQISHRLEFI
jgi:hypothetical protein